MKIRVWPKRRWLRVAVVVSAVVLVPSVFSRVVSPWRCLSVHCTSAVGGSATEPSDSQLRIACYNIAHGRGLAASNWDGGDRAERSARLDGIAELLRRIDADVVVLNEVDFDSSWSYSVNQARYLAEKAGYPDWLEQRNLDFRVLLWTWRSGNAVLSKYPLANARVVDLPGYSVWETVLIGKKRSVVCDVAVDGETIRVVGAHLSHRSEAVRVRSAGMLVDLARDGALPTIVAGDLNSTPPGYPESETDPQGANAIEAFDNSGVFQRQRLAQSPAVGDLTFHAAKPTCVIDWILIPPDWGFPHYRVALSQLSDHRPVYADVARVSAPTGVPQ